MRLLIVIDDGAGPSREAALPASRRGGSAAAPAADRLDTERRWDAILSGIGCLSDEPHEWDEDPAAWVRAQRRLDPRVVG